jgi:hypothetical protein
LAACLIAGQAKIGAAQTIGTFRWQALPFCNVLTLTVVQVGTVFTLDGFDDQCGATTSASVVGTAFFNLDGTIGIGLTTIATPGGAPVHMDVALSLATVSGPWRYSAGNLGTFVPTPGGGAGGTPRPLGHGLGAASIDPTQVQRRVTGLCAAGEAVRAVSEDGAVICEPAGSGDITAVTVGDGLTGGGTTGEVPLSVSFAGSGSAATAARSDHHHSVNSTANTTVGRVALQAVTDGIGNTALGVLALYSTTTGTYNTSVGAGSGVANETGSFNTSIGANSDANGSNFVNASAFGARARAGASNTLVLGSIAGVNGATASVNVGIGTIFPGFPLHVVSPGGAGRIHVGNQSTLGSGQSRTISFGDASSVYVGEEDASDRLVLAGAAGIRFKAAQGNPVAPDADNSIPLGSAASRWTAVYAANGVIQTSDARLKDRIADLDHGLADLMRLRPVSFHWKGSVDTPPSLGLLAQEVEDVIPEAVVHAIDPDEPLGMNYSSLVPVLIKAVQEQQSVLERQSARIDAVAPPPAAAQLLAGQFAIPVQPALDPVAFTLCTPEGPGATQTCDALGFPASYQVPAGKRLIIEQVAGSCGGDAEQDESTEAAIVARTAGVIVSHPISGSRLPTDLAIRIPLTLTRIYADPHSSVTIGLTRVSASNNRYCWLRFSGQLVKP